MQTLQLVVQCIPTDALCSANADSLQTIATCIFVWQHPVYHTHVESLPLFGKDISLISRVVRAALFNTFIVCGNCRSASSQGWPAAALPSSCSTSVPCLPVAAASWLPRAHPVALVAPPLSAIRSVIVVWS